MTFMPLKKARKNENMPRPDKTGHALGSAVFLGCTWVALLLLASCATFQEQHQPLAEQQQETLFDFGFEKPSDEIAPADSTGTLSAAAQCALEAKEQKAALGEYTCCTAPSCNQCLILYGKCDCKYNLLNGKDMCGECLEGWVEGRGSVLGQTVKDARKAFKAGRKRASRSE